MLNTEIALAHDSFTQMGGAERVMEALHQMFPEAPVYTLVLDKKLRQKYQGWDIRTSPLQFFYNLHPKLQHWLFFIPWAVGALNFQKFNVVISSSSGFIKNIKLPKGVIHICYCHTPTRFLWIDKDYVSQEVPGVMRPLVKLFLSWMKKWDYAGAKRATQFIANSAEVQKRIQSVYQRTSTVVHPGVDTEFWKPTLAKSDYFLLAGRLQAHKHNELMVEVFNDLKIPLHVVGTGRQESYLKSIAGPNVKFLGRISDEDLRNEYSGALGFLYPQVEDFGLMPLEAAACGTATLAFARGGALETVVPGVTGEFFGIFDVVQARGLPSGQAGLPNKQGEALHYKEQIKQLISSWSPQKYRTEQLRAQADKFSKDKFKQRIFEFISQLTK